MAKSRSAWIVGILFALWTCPTAEAAPDLYDDAELRSDAVRYAERFDFLLRRGMLEFMSDAERQSFADVVVIHPLRGAGPLAFKYAPIPGEAPTIVAPAATLKFIEDLSVVYAYRSLRRTSLEPVDEYLAMLKHRQDKFSGAARPEPLPTLGVPPRIWETDKAVDDLSLRFRNTAWAFLLAHELGHLYHGHDDKPATAEESRDREIAADSFAADILARSGTIPMGMILWLQASAGYMPNRADFEDDAAFEDWLREGASHPINGARMRNLAGLMQDQAGRVSDPNEADTLEFISSRLQAIGAIVEDADMQSYLRRCADIRSPSDLSRPDDRACQ